MSDCRFGVSPVNYPDPDPDFIWKKYFKSHSIRYWEPDWLFRFTIVFQLNNGKNIWSSLKTQWQLPHLTNDCTVWPWSAKQLQSNASKLWFNWRFSTFRAYESHGWSEYTIGCFFADRRNFNAYNARQMFLVENVLVKNHKNTIIYNNNFCCALQNLPVFY